MSELTFLKHAKGTEQCPKQEETRNRNLVRPYMVTTAGLDLTLVIAVRGFVAGVCNKIYFSQLSIHSILVLVMDKP